MKKPLFVATISALALSFSPAFAEEVADAPKGPKGPPKGEKGPHGHSDAETIFKSIDTDKNGSVSISELAASKRFENADEKVVGEAFKDRDGNSDGSIDLPEFAKGFSPPPHGKGKGKGPGDGKRKGPGDGKGKGPEGGKGKGPEGGAAQPAE